MKIKNSTRAVLADSPAMPLNPTTPATIAMTKNAKPQRSMGQPFSV
jgi:hypothetical protein